MLQLYIVLYNTLAHLDQGGPFQTVQAFGALFTRAKLKRVGY